MNMSGLDFLEGDLSPSTAAPEIAAPEPVNTVDPTPEGPSRGPDGRFAPKQAAEVTETPQDGQPPTPAPSEPQPEPSPVAPPAPPAPNQDVEALRAELAGMKRALAASRQKVREAPPRPEVWDDNDHAFFDSEIQAVEQDYGRQVASTNFHWSKRYAEKEYGAEKVTAALQWATARCDEDPIFNQRIGQSQDPFSVIMAEHEASERDALLRDPAVLNYLRQLQAGQVQQQAAPAAPPQQQVARPPTSLVTAPSAAGASHTPVGPGAAFDALPI